MKIDWSDTLAPLRGFVGFSEPLRDVFNPTGQAAGLNTCQGICWHADCMKNLHDVGSCSRASLFDLHIFLKCKDVSLLIRQHVHQTERYS